MSDRLVVGILKVVSVLNLTDALFSIYYIETGAATEGNPLMAMAYSVSALVFAVSKFALVGFGIYVLFHFRGKRFAKIGCLFVLPIYAIVVGYHLIYLTY